MKTKFLLSITLLLLSGSSLFVRAQEEELSLYTRIVTSVEEKEPEWKLNRKAIMPHQVVIRWASNEKRALISVALLGSDGEAQEALKYRVNLLEHSPESKVSKRELKEFGEECYLLKDERVNGAHVIFRTGNYVVEVFGPSERIAKRFAHHVSDLLLKSNKSLKSTA